MRYDMDCPRNSGRRDIRGNEYGYIIGRRQKPQNGV